MSKFALLCQAAHVLGQFPPDDRGGNADSDGDPEIWTQLDRTLESMLAVALDVERPDHDQITFIYRFGTHAHSFYKFTMMITDVLTMAWSAP